MGIFIDYAFHADCSERQLLERMRRLRRRLLTLPFDSVSQVLPVNPAYQPLLVELLPKHGYPLPAAVRRRVRGKLRTKHDELCFLAAPPVLMHVPDELLRRFYEPALEFCRTTTLWREDQLPEKLDVPYCLTYYRAAFALELASVMLRRGHLIVVRPCEGCETLAIGLTSFGTEGERCWLGSGFTKTQYATRFVEAHESICTALDFAREEGLLLAAEDTCDFYAHRDWSKSADVVNTETQFAHVMGGLIDLGVEQARKQGTATENLSSPATRHLNVIRVDEPPKRRRHAK